MQHAEKTLKPLADSKQTGVLAKPSTAYAAIHNSPRMVAQRRQLRGLFGAAVQLHDGSEGEAHEPGPDLTAQCQATDSAHANRTGLPDGLKAGIESLSGMSMDHVKVHYNSPQPAQLNALAYAQGADIHVAPGQQHHLPHEAWHVVQQAQGRVQPTRQMSGGRAINDDAALEQEADVMGAQAGAGPAQRVGDGTRQGLPLAVGGPMQLKWIHQPDSPWMIWDRQLDGLRWFYIPATDISATDMMYYEVEEISPGQEHLRLNAGPAHARKHEDWADVGFGPGDWSESDAEVVPFVPAPEEKIKLGNSKREMTRESLERQATGFIKSTASGSSDELFKQFLQQAKPVAQGALMALREPDKINTKLINRLIDIVAYFDAKAHGGDDSLKKSAPLIEDFKAVAIKEMIDVAKGKLLEKLKQILKVHGPEDQFDALTAAGNLLKRFAGNAKMSDLHKLVEVHNLIGARLLALESRKKNPIVAQHEPLSMDEFPRAAPALTLGSSVVELERSYDVLSRRTGATKDQATIHIHEVDLAFVQVFQGITEAYANPSGDTGDQLVFGGGGGVGEKVFAAEHGGSMGFRADVKKREERFYGLIFPKGFVRQYGLDIRKKSDYDPKGSASSKLKGSVREPNEAEFSEHVMRELNGDPQIEIPLNVLFFVRAETSTPGGQVDIHFSWRDMMINDRKMHHPDFFRQYVLGVVEFTKLGRIIRYQKLR